MFSDPIILQADSTSPTSSHSLARIDTDTGKGVYAKNSGSGAFVKGSIQHTVTKENGPTVLTDRHLIRFELEKPETNTGKPLRSFVQLTVGVPRSQFTNSEVQHLLYGLLNFLDNKSSSFDTSSTRTGPAQTLVRLLNGEI